MLPAETSASAALLVARLGQLFSQSIEEGLDFFNEGVNVGLDLLDGGLQLPSFLVQEEPKESKRNVLMTVDDYEEFSHNHLSSCVSLGILF